MTARRAVLAAALLLVPIATVAAPKPDSKGNKFADLHDLVKTISFAGIEDGPWQIDVSKPDGSSLARNAAQLYASPLRPSMNGGAWDEVYQQPSSSSKFHYLSDLWSWTVVVPEGVGPPDCASHLCWKNTTTITDFTKLFHVIKPLKWVDDPCASHCTGHQVGGGVDDPPYHKEGVYRIDSFRQSNPPVTFTGYYQVKLHDAGPARDETIWTDRDLGLPWPRAGSFTPNKPQDAAVIWKINWVGGPDYAIPETYSQAWTTSSTTPN